jgi:hypothetical protein
MFTLICSNVASLILRPGICKVVVLVLVVLFRMNRFIHPDHLWFIKFANFRPLRLHRLREQSTFDRERLA